MALFDTALVAAANAIDALITHGQLHSAAPGGSGTANVVSTARVAINGSVDGDGDITITASWTGLTPGQTVGGVSYRGSAGTGTPPTGGTCYGAGVPTGDLAANAAGEYTATIVETSSAT
jgi:hypothetical protein